MAADHRIVGVNFGNSNCAHVTIRGVRGRRQRRGAAYNLEKALQLGPDRLDLGRGGPDRLDLAFCLLKFFHFNFFLPKKWADHGVHCKVCVDQERGYHTQGNSKFFLWRAAVLLDALLTQTFASPHPPLIADPTDLPPPSTGHESEPERHEGGGEREKEEASSWGTVISSEQSLFQRACVRGSYRPMVPLAALVPFEAVAWRTREDQGFAFPFIVVGFLVRHPSLRLG
eukprot:3907910-Rhodomonas_salina.2